MDKTYINQRVEALRELLRREHLSAFIFPTTDPHNSEYTAEHWKSRQWISGFNGSAGTAVVTLCSAALWTDSRYFIAAAEQLQGTPYQLMRQGQEDTPSVAEWLEAQFRDHGDVLTATEVGIDGLTSSVASVADLQQSLRRHGGLTLRTNFDPVSRLWTDRPCVPLNPIVVQPLSYAGEPVGQKLVRVRRALRDLHADGMLMAALDDIAWTLNLRGTDVHCNPVFVGYLLVSTQQACLFTHEAKLTPEVRAHLSAAGVSWAPYDDVAGALRRYPDYNILIDPAEVSHTLATHVRAPQVVSAPSPVAALKAVKNAAEQEGFRHAMERDGVALVQLLRWLKPAVAAGGQTEYSVGQQLEALRARQPLYRGLSFDTIAGYEAHGAIVHYEATPESAALLRPEGLLLLDSGGQYQDGTTDVTRTIALGPVSDEQRRVYTLVLKGHIQLQLLRFPDGASGTQLDAIARAPLWREGLNYYHGTGHGVGAYLNVHEGPHQIRMEYRPAPLHAGMTVTDEPGIYLEGRFGVRIENTLLVVPDRETELGRFLRFETLTLCPIDTAPLLPGLLTAEEVAWLDDYHATVYRRLAPLLDDDDRQWLREATLPLAAKGDS